jgi:hypothetical protein
MSFYEEVMGTLVFALAKIDQKEYEEAKQYITGALQLFDDKYKVSEEEKTVDRKPGDKSNKRFRSGTKKRLKKS